MWEIVRLLLSLLIWQLHGLLLSLHLLLVLLIKEVLVQLLIIITHWLLGHICWCNPRSLLLVLLLLLLL